MLFWPAAEGTDPLVTVVPPLPVSVDVMIPPPLPPLDMTLRTLGGGGTGCCPAAEMLPAPVPPLDSCDWCRGARLRITWTVISGSGG